MCVSRLQGRQYDLHPAVYVIILFGSVIGLTGVTVDAKRFSRVGRLTATLGVDDFSHLPAEMSNCSLSALVFAHVAV